MKAIILSLLITFVFIGNAFPQKYWERQFKDYKNPDELVTLSQSLPFSEAIALLSKVSESTTGKRIVSTVDSQAPIGIEIENMPYDKALLIIAQYNGYVFEEKEDVIIVKKPGVEEVKKMEEYASVDTREVKVSAVFFEVDVQETKTRGIDWRVILSGNGLDLGGELLTEAQSSQDNGGSTQQQTPANFNLGAAGDFDLGSFYGRATAMFRLFEQNNLGEIIASPSITVRDRNQGRIQVGSDFSVRTRDFAGNTVEKFFPTGTIIQVTPYVHHEGGLDYVLMNIEVERSSFFLNEQTTEIRKTNATTQVLALDGEEAVLGGLFVNEETIVRNGIPVLKDLPWWVFGIRYLTGSDSKELRKKELVILLKIELLPTLKERFENPMARKDVLKREIETQSERIKYYQLNTESSKTLEESK